MERHWIDNVADVVSGRIHNTVEYLRRELLSLRNTVIGQQKEIQIMTQNEQIITDAAATLSQAATELEAGISGIRGQLQSANDHIATLEQQIIQLNGNPPAAPEDLSQEFTQLDTAVQGIKTLADGLTPATAGTPADGATATTSTAGAAPISHGDNPPIGIGVGSDPPQPGTGGTNLPEGMLPTEPAPTGTPDATGTTTAPPATTPAAGTDVPADGSVEDAPAPVAPADAVVPPVTTEPPTTDDDFE